MPFDASSIGEDWAGFGEIALDRGYLTPGQWQAAIEEQTSLARQGESMRIGQLLVRSGLLTGTQLCEILSLQRGRAVHPSMHGRIGKYRVKREIARGGMGVVLEAEDPELKRTVALKLLIEEEHADDAVRRFHREATIAAGLKHPNIIGIHEVGTAVDEWGKEVHYIAMDYVAGTTLSDRIAQGRTPREDLIRILEVVARAVSHAHARGVVHRDLKPSNVLLENGGRVVLTDFGLACANDSRTRITKSGEVVGTPEYMAPEQVLGRWNTVDERADVYALGVTMYKMLTGRSPFVGKTPADVLAQITTQEPERPSSLVPSVPKELDTICLKTLEKNRSRRYPSATAFAEDLARFLRGEPILARPPNAAYRLRKLLFRHRWALGATVTTLLVGLLVGAYFRGRTEQSAEIQKRRQSEREAARLESELTYRDLGRELYSLRARQYRSDGRLTEDHFRKFDEVKRRCRDQMTRTGDSAEGWWIVGQADEICGDAAGASAAFDRGLAIDGEHGRCLLSKARLLLRRVLGRRTLQPGAREADRRILQDALSLLERGIRRGRVDEIQKDLAEGYRRLLVGEDVFEFCTAMIAKWKDLGQDGWEDFHLIRGQSRPERLFEEAQDVLRIQPGSSAVWFLSGHGAEIRGDWTRALADYSRALELNPRYANAYFRRAECLAAKSDVAGALEDFGRAIEVDPKFSEAYNNRGSLYLRQKDYPRAMRDFELAIESDEWNVMAYVNLGNTYLVTSDTALAIRSYERAVEVSPRFAPAWYSLGNAYCRLGEFDRALENLTRALDVQPNFAQAYSTRALAHQARKDLPAAMEDFQQALKLNPAQADAYWNRAEAFWGQREYRRAVADYDEYIRLTTGTPPKADSAYSISWGPPSILPDQAFYRRGLAHFALREMIPALRDFGATIARNPSHVGAYWNRLHVWKILWRTGEAMGDAEQLLKIAPGDWPHRPQAEWELELMRMITVGSP